MKKVLWLATALSLSIAGLADASVDEAAAGPSPGGLASDNVEFITHVPLNNDSAGGALLGDYFYITSSRGLIIYNVSDPLAPTIESFLPLVQDPYFAEEDPDTNGNILLVGATGVLNVVDVEDKTNPQIIGTLDGADSHTVTCVLDCTWAYNSNGQIIDLRKPTAPKIAGDWAEGTPAQGAGHDVTEVAPGLIVTSSTPVLYLDARKNPAKPKVLAVGPQTGSRYIHGSAWPNRGTDRFLLVGGESGAGTCDAEGDGSFMTFDASRWKKTKKFTMIDEYFIGSGLPTEGKLPAAQYCAHWFEPHRTYRDGGLVAMAWYENGTHFMDISSKGKISEVGYFFPFAGSTSAVYWVTDEILYTVDYNRGIDIIRFTGKP